MQPTDSREARAASERAQCAQIVASNEPLKVVTMLCESGPVAVNVPAIDASSNMVAGVSPDSAGILCAAR